MGDQILFNGMGPMSRSVAYPIEDVIVRPSFATRNSYNLDSLEMGNACRKRQQEIEDETVAKYCINIDDGIWNVRHSCHMTAAANEYDKDLASIMKMRSGRRVKALDELSYRIAMTIVAALKQQGRSRGL